MRPALTWFAVLGGVVAWSLHVLLAWAVMEITCLAATDIAPTVVAQRAGDPGPAAWSVAIGGTALPWLVAVAAAVTSLVMHRRNRRLREDPGADMLATERTAFLVEMAIYLNLFSVAAITAGGIALMVLEPCG